MVSNGFGDGSKPKRWQDLPAEVMAQFNDAYISHQSSMCSTQSAGDLTNYLDDL